MPMCVILRQRHSRCVTNEGTNNASCPSWGHEVRDKVRARDRTPQTARAAINEEFEIV